MALPDPTKHNRSSYRGDYNPETRVPTREQRLKKFIDKLQGEIDRQGICSDAACAKIPTRLELVIRKAPVELKEQAIELRKECKKRSILSQFFFFVNLKRLRFIILLALIAYMIATISIATYIIFAFINPPNPIEECVTFYQRVSVCYEKPISTIGG